jgi:hypothetical protein
MGMQASRLLAGLTLILVGCGQGEDSPKSPAPPRTSNQSPLDVRGLDAPLTSAELERFVEIVSQLPGGNPPEPMRGTPSPEIQQLPPRERLAAWRAHLRKQLSPEVIADSWKYGSKVHSSLEAQHVSAQAFASLMGRVSLAWTAAAVAEQLDAVAEARRTETKVEIQLRDLEEFERQARQKGVVPRDWLAQRETLWTTLEETASLAEFLRFIGNVSPESRAAIERHRSTLAKMLPDVKQSVPFERFHEGQIKPVSFEEPQPAGR